VLYLWFRFSNRSGGVSAADDQDESWGFTPRCLMEDSERFKECEQLLLQCKACQSQQPFTGPVTESGGKNGLSCSSCGVMYWGRRLVLPFRYPTPLISLQTPCPPYRSPSDLYCYISNRVTLLVRKCVSQYYDCWLRCDDPVCGRWVLY
jgi:DNA Polymerase alpha zinc finger